MKKTKKKYCLRCMFCGAEIYTDDFDRRCYKCEKRMNIIQTYIHK